MVVALYYANSGSIFRNRWFNFTQVWLIRYAIINLPVTEDILSPPSYKKRAGAKRKMTEEIVERLRGFIQDNEWKRKNNMSKQQMKKIDMHEKLQEEGYDIGYTTV